MNKLPPYGKAVAQNPQNVFVYSGADAWVAGEARARFVGRNAVLVLPSGEDFHAYHWPVQGVPLLLVWPDGDIAEVRDFARHLVCCGSPHVVAPHKQDPEFCIYARPMRAAA